REPIVPLNAWLNLLTEFATAVDQPRARACVGALLLVASLNRANPFSFIALVAFFGIRCEGYLAGFAAASVSASFHFLIRSTVEFFSSQPKLILTIPSLEAGRYRGALQ